MSEDTSSLQIKTFDPKEKKTDRRRRKTTKEKGKKPNRATWNDDINKIRVLIEYRSSRPLGVAHGEVTKQWMEMTKAINKQLPSGAVPFAKPTIIAQLKKLMDQYKSTFSEYEVSKTSGSNRFGSDLEREAYRTWQMVKNIKKFLKK
jgi:hypothetical protein